MKRAVLVLCDGHRSDFCGGDMAPAIAALSDRGRRCTRHRSIVPSVTRSVSAAIATGCLPMRNGIHGNLMALEDRGGMSVIDLGDRIFEVLHTPLQTPGSICLWESATGSLFISDVMIIGPGRPSVQPRYPEHLDSILARFVALPVGSIYPGHYDSFGLDDLEQAFAAYRETRPV